MNVEQHIQAILDYAGATVDTQFAQVAQLRSAGNLGDFRL